MTPTRIVVDADGHARAPRPGDTWDVVFVRNDGWSLAAPERFRDVARGMWPREWIETIEGRGGLPRLAHQTRLGRVAPHTTCQRINHRRLTYAVAVAYVNKRALPVCLSCARWCRRNGYDVQMPQAVTRG